MVLMLWSATRQQLSNCDTLWEQVTIHHDRSFLKPTLDRVRLLEQELQPNSEFQRIKTVAVTGRKCVILSFSHCSWQYNYTQHLTKKILIKAIISYNGLILTVTLLCRIEHSVYILSTMPLIVNRNTEVRPTQQPSPGSRLPTSFALEHFKTSAAKIMKMLHLSSSMERPLWSAHCSKHHFYTSLKNSDLFTSHEAFPSHVMVNSTFWWQLLLFMFYSAFLVILPIVFSTRVPNSVVS